MSSSSTPLLTNPTSPPPAHKDEELNDDNIPAPQQSFVSRAFNLLVPLLTFGAALVQSFLSTTQPLPAAYLAAGMSSFGMICDYIRYKLKLTVFFPKLLDVR